MKKSFISACLAMSAMASSHVHACSNVSSISGPDYKVVLQEWLGCKNAPNNAEIAKYWADFGFQKSAWDDGLGWEGWCNEKLPLGKTFAAIKLLKDGWNLRVTDPKHRHALTTGAHGYASKHIEHLEFACKGSDVGTSDDANAFTDYGIFSDDETFLFRKGVGSPLVELAATIMHEARHSDLGWWSGDHVDCDKGSKADDACDETLNEGGAWAYSIAWRINYAYHGKEAAGQARLTACNNANDDISLRINKNEGLRCRTDLIDIQLPTPKCPSSRPSGTLIAQSTSSYHTSRTYFSSTATLSSSNSTSCTYSGKITTTYSTSAGSGSSTSDGTKTWPLTEWYDTYDDILPSYKY